MGGEAARPSTAAEAIAEFMLEETIEDCEGGGGGGGGGSGGGGGGGLAAEGQGAVVAEALQVASVCVRSPEETVVAAVAVLLAAGVIAVIVGAGPAGTGASEPAGTGTAPSGNAVAGVLAAWPEGVLARPAVAGGNTPKAVVEMDDALVTDEEPGDSRTALVVEGRGGAEGADMPVAAAVALPPPHPRLAAPSGRGSTGRGTLAGGVAGIL